MSLTAFKSKPAARAHADKMAATGVAYAVIPYREYAMAPFARDWKGWRVLPVYDLGHADRPVYKTAGRETFHRPSNAPALAAADNAPALGGARA